MRTRIAVIGPISKGDLAANIQQAVDATLRLIKAGYAPWTPALSAYLGGPAGMPIPDAFPGDVTHDEWLASTLPWVRVSHAVLRLPGFSVGADREAELAQAFKIPVFYDEETLMATVPPKQRKPTPIPEDA